MKHRATIEQIAAQQEKKARMRSLARQVAAMDDVQRDALAKTCPVLTIEGRALSLKNQCLIALQMPSATVVGGFRQWLKAGRCVRKGEHGACIWIPLGKKDVETGEIEMTDSRAFILASVFNITQTAELEEKPSEETNEAIVEHAGNLAPGFSLEAQTA